MSDQIQNEVIQKDEMNHEEMQNSAVSRDESATSKGKKMGNKFSEMVKRFCGRIVDIFREYPVTMAAVIIAALFGAILIDVSGKEAQEILEKCIAFCLIASFQVLAVEELLKKKLLPRIIGYVVSFAVSGFYIFLFFFEGDFLFGMEADIVLENAAKILIVYSFITVSTAIWHMFRRLEEDFEVYATKAFIELGKATVVYGLFAIGLAILIWIFNELIFDTDEFLAQVELFLAGGIYVPMCLHAISGKNEKPGKFSRFCIVFVVFPMLILSMIILYLYMIVSAFRGGFESNWNFFFFSLVFAIGMPVWTMIHALEEKKSFWRRISDLIPYLFLPMLICQAVCMFIRIYNYGMTVGRYYAVCLMIFEICYFIFYVLGKIRKNQLLSMLIFVVTAMVTIGLLVPGLRYDDVIIRSQMPRLISMIDQEGIKEEWKRSVSSSAREITSIGYRGQRAFENELTQAQRDKVSEYSNLSYTYDRNILSIYDNIGFDDVDISGYKRIYKVKIRQGSSPKTVKISSNGSSVVKPLEWDNVDISALLDYTAENYSQRTTERFSLIGHEVISVDDRYDCYLSYISCTFNEDTFEIRSFSGDGYLLEKE